MVVRIIRAPADKPKWKCGDCPLPCYYELDPEICAGCRALTAVKNPAPVPYDPTYRGEKPYGLLEALQELVTGREGTLMLTHKVSGVGYLVTSHYKDGTTQLTSTSGKVISAVITEREAALYEVSWR